MSLFSEIRRLCMAGNQQTEDTLTEIVAVVLRNNHELARQWLEKLGIPGGHEAHIHSIETQYRVPGLPDHQTDSRIDLVIRFSTQEGSRVAFVESKVDSGQGDGQLQRYAELLQEECRQYAANGDLVFITKVFEQAGKPSVNGWGFSFHRSRWFQFYNILKSRSSSDGLEKQLMLFMEENHMSVGNQFRSTDLVALENFRGAKALMDETLCEACADFRTSFGKRGQLNKAHSKMGKTGLYMIETKFPGFNVLMGYWLPEGHSDKGVSLGLVIQSEPKAENRMEVVKCLRDWVAFSNGNWEPWGLDNPSEKGDICRWRWLREFQAKEDHVAAVKDFFKELLVELEEFRRMFPNLPWTPQENPAGDDD